MASRQTDYFGTFLKTLNAEKPAPSSAQPSVSLDAVVKVLHGGPMTVAAVARTFDVTLDAAADQLFRAQKLGLVQNQGGLFTLTAEGEGVPG